MKLCEIIRNFERPRLQNLIEKLTSLRKELAETVTDYINRAEDLQYSLLQIGEAVLGTNVHLYLAERTA